MLVSQSTFLKMKLFATNSILKYIHIYSIKPSSSQRYYFGKIWKLNYFQQFGFTSGFSHQVIDWHPTNAIFSSTHSSETVPLRSELGWDVTRATWLTRAKATDSDDGKPKSRRLHFKKVEGFLSVQKFTLCKIYLFL